MLAVLAAASLCGAAPLAPVTVGGPFELQAAGGATVTERTFRGRWLLVYFGYTFCPDTCPTVLNEIATALHQLGPEAAKIQPLFITVDPAHDTPQVLAEYVGTFDARIVGLTGTPQQIARVLRAYGAYSRRLTATEGGTRLLDHSSYLYLMTPAGDFARGFDPDSAGPGLAERLRSYVSKPPA